MLNQEERITLSLRGFASLLKVNSQNIAINIGQIDQYLDEMKNENFENIDNFINLSDYILNVLMENIKKYAQREKNEKIEMLNEYLVAFFKYEMFDNQTILDSLKKGDRDSLFNNLKSDIKAISNGLNLEKKNERRIKRGKRPARSMIKSIFISEKLLRKEIIKKGFTVEELEEEENNIRNHIKELLNEINQDNKESKINEIRNYLEEFAFILKEEFEALHKSELDVEIQEYDLIKEINEIEKNTEDTDIKRKLNTLKTKIQSHCREDFYVAKRLLEKITTFNKNIKGQLRKKKNSDEKIQAITEFHYENQTLSVINLDDKNLIIVCPEYILDKHGEKGEQVGSKFEKIDNTRKLYKLIINGIDTSLLSDANKIELKNIDAGKIIGKDALIDINEREKWGDVYKEMIRGFEFNIVYTDKKIPSTRLFNIVLGKFDSKQVGNISKDFYFMYKRNIDEFKAYFLISCFPGKYAPSNKDVEFWSKHALLKDKKTVFLRFKDFEKKFLLRKLGIEGDINKNYYMHQNTNLEFAKGYIIVPKDAVNEVNEENIITIDKPLIEILKTRPSGLYEQICKMYKRLTSYDIEGSNKFNYNQFKKGAIFVFFFAAAYYLHTHKNRLGDNPKLREAYKKKMKEEISSNFESLMNGFFGLFNKWITENNLNSNMENMHRLACFLINRADPSAQENSPEINPEFGQVNEFINRHAEKYNYLSEELGNIIEEELEKKFEEMNKGKEQNLVNAIYNKTNELGILIPFDADKEFKKIAGKKAKGLSVPDYIFVSKKKIVPIDLKTTISSKKETQIDGQNLKEVFKKMKSEISIIFSGTILNLE